jgi:FixJ family two-component response regulator
VGNKASSASPLTTGLEPIVYVVDDDVGIRDGLSRLLRSVGLRSEVYASANEFLQSKHPPIPSCLILDVRLPGLGGFELHTELVREQIRMPIIFITAHADVPMSVRAMKSGAVDFLTKPFRDQDLLDAVNSAIASERARLVAQGAQHELQNLFGNLTPREQEVMTLVTAGLLNKQIAADIGISEITVKIHRMHLMKKMRAKSLADLVKMAGRLDLTGVRAQRF